MSTVDAIAFAKEFDGERLHRFDKLIAQYEIRRSALLPTLYLAQEQWGFLTDDALKYVAKILEMPAREVFEAASFYTMFHRKNMGRYCLEVCQNITCTMMGAEKLVAALKALEIDPHTPTRDGLFSMVPVQCLGSCDTAPVIQINSEYFENMTAEKLVKVVNGLKENRSLESLREEA